MEIKYSDQILDWLLELGYTHCFFVGGGNVMHLLESARKKLTCVPVVHEVAAGIAAEYFNESNQNGKKAFALVTAGPGVTNIITALGGAWLESRELLVIAGQAKTTNLAKGFVRQIGHQEIDGKSLAQPFSKKSILLEKQIGKLEFNSIVSDSFTDRKGPVFIEICIDVTAQPSNIIEMKNEENEFQKNNFNYEEAVANSIELLKKSKRPTFLLGGGLNRQVAWDSRNNLRTIGIPIGCTWNGMDRFSFSEDLSYGRPNTYGMRSANITIQQSDLVFAIGTRLGLQQTGFAWDKFAENAKIIQVDIDKNELIKGHPKIDLALNCDANIFFPKLINEILKLNIKFDEWVEYIKNIKTLIPLKDKSNIARSDYIEAYEFVSNLSKKLKDDDVVIPCSSGGAFTTMMSGFINKPNQIVITNKGLASMGYGLSGAIGASISNPKKRCILVEGDGGFAQNLQELGTVKSQDLNLKIFIFSNDGYASIKTMQKAYFNGNYIGCDAQTGVGLPNWEKLVESYDLPVITLNNQEILENQHINELLNYVGPAVFVVPIDPEQTYLPKITSKLNPDGTMTSNPLHLMSPPLEEEIAQKVMKYI